jgi:hypothetical protein
LGGESVEGTVETWVEAPPVISVKAAGNQTWVEAQPVISIKAAENHQIQILIRRQGKQL